VQPHRDTKSVGAEDTFPYDLTELDELYNELDKIARNVCKRLDRHSLKGRTITLKIKYHNFKVITRSMSLPSAVCDLDTIVVTAKELLSKTDPEEMKIRLLGISVSNFGDVIYPMSEPESPTQLRLF
jgi:DNA polymerase-4